MVSANLRSVRRASGKNSSWFRWKILASDFLLIKLAKYSMLFSRPRNTVPVWDCASAERLLRPMGVGSGLRITIRAAPVFISRWLFLRIRGARTPELWPLEITADLLLRSHSFASDKRLYPFLK